MISDFRNHCWTIPFTFLTTHKVWLTSTKCCLVKWCYEIRATVWSKLSHHDQTEKTSEHHGVDTTPRLYLPHCERFMWTVKILTINRGVYVLDHPQSHARRVTQQAAISGHLACEARRISPPPQRSSKRREPLLALHTHFFYSLDAVEAWQDEGYDMPRSRSVEGLCKPSLPSD